MPRILPRLLEKIESQASQERYFALKNIKRSKDSSYKPSLPIPSFHPADHPRSILLSPQSPVTNAREYTKHKRIPPALSNPGKINVDLLDPPRQMSNTELRWWANPYLRILSSPIRVCMVTQRHLPSDLLLRLVGVRLPTSQLHRAKKPLAKLVPDGILHPKYANRKVSGGSYVLCWRKAVLQLERGSYKRLSPDLTLYPNLSNHIAHLLRLRVLQEFELLAQRLEYAVKSRKNLGTSDVILRRLTREQWDLTRSTGTLPYKNALAVLVVPPLKRDLVTGQRVEGSFSPLPPDDEQFPKNAPPISALLASSIDAYDEGLPSILPSLQIPLYNSISAFPSRAQRSALHSSLMRILAAERHVKRLHASDNSESLSLMEDKATSKGSHAFLLCSDEGTAKRGDSAAIACALWRLRLYESEGWESPLP